MWYRRICGNSTSLRSKSSTEVVFYAGDVNTVSLFYHLEGERTSVSWALSKWDFRLDKAILWVPIHFLSKKTVLVHSCSNTLLWWNGGFSSKVNTCWLLVSWGKCFSFNTELQFTTKFSRKVEVNVMPISFPRAEGRHATNESLPYHLKHAALTVEARNKWSLSSLTRECATGRWHANISIFSSRDKLKI